MHCPYKVKQKILPQKLGNLLFITDSVQIYSDYFMKEALEGFWILQIGGQVIQAVKYVENLVLLVDEDTLVFEIGRCNRMEINVEKTQVMISSKQSSPVQIMIDHSQQDNVEILNYLDSIITNDERRTCAINP
jgi:hypothetical protein